MNIFALIPARGGSQRIPNKNLYPLRDAPLIAYTIACAKKAKRINRVVVSADSKEIAEVARRYGAEVPFLRPANISRDDSTELEFLEHALGWFSEHERYEPELIVQLYPTTPFRRPETIDRAVEEMLRHPEANSLRSVRLCSEHPYKMWTIRDGRLEPFVDISDPNVHTWPYQRLPPVYVQNASIYITKPATIWNKHSPVGDVVIPFIMDERESFDINTPLDMKVAEMMAGETSEEDLG